MWGRADAFDLTFDLGKSGEWQASVPADLEDGQYACEIWAENAIGEQTYWTGMLYMVDSRLVCIHLANDPYQVVLLPDRTGIALIDDRYVAVLKRGCACVANV
ncbi:PF13754 domain-containing protein [Anaeromassilibacillus senegalensis]|uniref:PF13754 domain-containing protein n=1 Tax=Anaeromassilibacillus senegalensis TaxID=1673717 RepID=UPI001FA806EE|nr:PF13754 domain-containing protein [Anaeromassilibacillus senegalensis]